MEKLDHNIAEDIDPTYRSVVPAKLAMFIEKLKVFCCLLVLVQPQRQMLPMRLAP